MNPLKSYFFLNGKANNFPSNESCFDDCYSLEKVYFDVNSQLENILPLAFNTATNLTYINIPSSVKVIGRGAFSEISVHLNIYYCGKKKFDDASSPFYSTNDYSIIVPFGGVSSFLGTKTIHGKTPCEVINIVHTCRTKKQSISRVFVMILLISN